MSEEDRKRYAAATHAVQSGVAMKMNYDPAETTPKHLRTGVNVMMSDLGAIADLLVKKGLITQDEYEKAIADNMEREKKDYEDWLNDRICGQTKITLA